MYKSERKLLYPVNVGRNVARESAPTHYILASDIELYPSPDLPVKFLEMIRRSDQPALLRPNPKVFVLSIFEVDEKSQPPANKTVLVNATCHFFFFFFFLEYCFCFCFLGPSRRATSCRKQQPREMRHYAALNFNTISNDFFTND
jgi:hypothetical protein